MAPESLGRGSSATCGGGRPEVEGATDGGCEVVGWIGIY